MRLTSNCGGSGSWTRMPCTAGLRLSSSIVRITASGSISAGELLWNDRMPTSARALILLRTIDL